MGSAILIPKESVLACVSQGFIGLLGNLWGLVASSQSSVLLLGSSACSCFFSAATLSPFPRVVSNFLALAQSASSVHLVQSQKPPRAENC